MKKTIHSKEVSEFSLSRIGVLTTRYFGAYFKLKKDIRCIFPYINASVADTRYYDQPEYLQFFLHGIKCSLYSSELIAASFTDEHAALSFFERFIDFINDLYHRRNSIRPDYRRYRPPSVIDILKLLPKSNCKACGYATCMAFAAALRNDETIPDNCPGFASPINIRKTYPILDDNGNLTSTVTIDLDMPEEVTATPPSNRLVPTDPELSREIRHRDSTLPKPVPHGTSNNGDVITDVSEPGDEVGKPPLTQREIQVLKYITAGATNTEIAENLTISPHTVKSHVVHIFNKLGVNDRTQAAVWATRHNVNGE